MQKFQKIWGENGMLCIALYSDKEKHLAIKKWFKNYKEQLSNQKKLKHLIMNFAITRETKQLEWLVVLTAPLE